MPVMMALGDFRFSLSTAAYQELEKATEYRWESQSRLGRHPALQFIGAGHTDISLQGVVYPHFRGGLGQIERLRGLAGRGVPYFLISGHGRVLGLFAIASITDVNSVFLSNGAPKKIEFTIKLKSYGSDSAGM